MAIVLQPNRIKLKLREVVGEAKNDIIDVEIAFIKMARPDLSIQLGIRFPLTWIKPLSIIHMIILTLSKCTFKLSCFIALPNKVKVSWNKQLMPLGLSIWDLPIAGILCLPPY